LDNTKQLLNDFIVSEFLHDEPRDIAVNDNLIEDGVIDSLAILILIKFIEDRFSVSVDAEDIVLDNFESVEAISRLIDTKRGK
jgi:acyl carrier protein